MAIFLTACGDDGLPSLTDDEAERMGNYAAFTLMRFDASHRSRLVDLSTVVIPTPRPAKTPEPEEPAEQDKNNDTSGNGSATVNQDAATNVSMYELIQFPEGVTIEYTGSSITDSYPEGEDEAFSLDAGKGKRLLVLNFNLSNNSGNIASVNVFSQNPVLKVTVNGDYTRTSLVTMLTDDLSTYVGDLEPGQSEDLVLIIEIDNTVDFVNSLTISKKIDGTNYNVVLQ